MNNNIDILFDEYFPKLNKKFLKDNKKLKIFQKKVISNILNGNNTLCIMPTGGGKSLIYWLSGVALKGITIVISPLIALIDEQSEKIREQGYNVLTIHGGINPSNQLSLLKKFYNRELNPDFIFVSPERISTDCFFEYCIKARKDEIKLVVIDEVHCVSQWGISFRPMYKRIPTFFNDIYGKGNWQPRILALTATLNSKEINDICNEFCIGNNNIMIDELIMRNEISLKVLKFDDEKKKENKFWELLDIHRNEKTLVYVYRKYKKRGVEELTKEALSKGYKAATFHGDMSSSERQRVITDYKNNITNIIFATNAFGMGIDIPDIRVVIHFMIPESVEQYYQEIGRAARDKGNANAYVLYTNKNIQVKENYFIADSFPDLEKLDEYFVKITQNKIGQKTLDYYENEENQKYLPYLLDTGLVSIICKGISNLKILENVQNEDLKELFYATKNKSLISTAQKTGKNIKEIIDSICSLVLSNKIKLSKVVNKCLVIETQYKDITNEQKEEIEKIIEDRKQYKYELLKYFVSLLEKGNDSIQLHQEIGRYFGVSRHALNKIYSTERGDRVRSKSEVIIANLLYKHGIDYKYEEKLYYSTSKWIEPDFTIILKDKSKIYWEHLGMIGVESYDKHWKEKLDIYRKYFPNQYVFTYENTEISNSVLDKLKELNLI